MKVALDAALKYYASNDLATRDEVAETARFFHKAIAKAAPAAEDPWDGEWVGLVHHWLRQLSGDQRGSVRDAVNRIAAERNPPQMPMPLAQPSPRYSPVPSPPGSVVPEAWALLDKLNGPQPYPGAAAPIGPLVTRDELERELDKISGDLRSRKDVQQAAEALTGAPGHPTLVAGDTIRIRPEGVPVGITTTHVATVQHSSTEGFFALVPPGTFAEGRNDEIGPESAARLLKILGPACGGTVRQRTTLSALATEVVEAAQYRAKRVRELELESKEKETELREILGALPGYENDDTGTFIPEETSIGAAKRIMQELGVARARLRDLES